MEKSIIKNEIDVYHVSNEILELNPTISHISYYS